LKPASDYFIENHLLTATDSTIRIADTSINSKLASVIRKTLAGVASLDQEISVIDSDFILDHLPDLKNLAKRRDSLQLLINAVCSYCTSRCRTSTTSPCLCAISWNHLATSLLQSQDSGLFLTLIKSNSASYTDGVTSRKIVNPRVKEEFKGHLWITRDESFFEQFFLAEDALPEPPRFPVLPSGQAVVNWFRSY